MTAATWGLARGARRRTVALLAGMVLSVSTAGACAPRSAAPGAAEPTARTGFVAVGGGRLAYDVAGRGPAVLLVHGGLVDRRLWDDQFRDLARDHRVIRYDLRGLGQSSVPTKPFSPLDDLTRVLDALGARRDSIPGAQHHPPAEAPAAVTRLLRRFLGELER